MSTALPSCHREYRVLCGPKDLCNFAGSIDAAQLHRSFVGSPPLRGRPHFLRMTNREADPCVGKYLGRMYQLPLILRRLRTFFQRLAVPDPAFAGVAGEFEILRQFE